MAKKRQNRIYKDDWRIRNKVRYRYHNGAKPGDEQFAVRDPNNRNRMNIIRSPFPGRGDIRYSLSPNEKVMYKLHDGAPSPLPTSTGKPSYGFTSEEMTRFLDKRKQQETQRKNIWKAEQERRQRDYERQKAVWEKENAERSESGGVTQLDVNEVAEKMKDQGLLGQLGAVAARPGLTLIGQMQNDKSILNRTFDILSRPLFSVGETVETRIEKDKKDDKFGKVSSFLQGLVDFGSSFTPTAALDLMSDDKERVRDRIDTSNAIWRGFSGKSKTTPSTVLQQHYGASGVGGFAGGLGADIALDPLTYTPAGLFRVPFQALKTATRARSIKPVANVANALNEATPPLPRDLPFRDNVFDDIVDPKLPMNERMSRVDRLNDAIVQPIVRDKFDREAVQGLDDMVQQGRLSRGEADRVLGARGTPDFHRTVADITSRSIDRSNLLKKADPSVPSGMGAAPTPTSAVPDAIQAGARQVVDAATRRAQINRQMVKAPLEERAVLKSQVEQFDEAVGDLAPKISMARASLEGAKGSVGAAFRAAEKISSNATRAVTNINKLMSGQKLAPSHRPAQALARLNSATNDKEWESALMSSLGDNTDIAKGEVRSIVADYTNEVGVRPASTAFESREAFNTANRAWHLGLYKSLSDSFGERANSQVTQALINTADEDTLARLGGISPGGVASGAEKVVDETAEAISEDVASAWSQAADNFDRPTPKEITDLFQSIGEKSKTLEEGIKTQLYEIVAMADRLPMPQNLLIRLSDEGRVETNLSGEWDDFLAQRANVHIPVLAEFSYNNAIRRHFDPHYGVQTDIDELRQRLVGMANENVAFRVQRLKQSLGRTPRRERRASLNSLRNNGVVDDTTQHLLTQTQRILSPYQDTDFFRTAWGDSGQPNLGDLNRWLPEKFQFPGRTLPHGGAGKKFDREFLDWLPENTDPLDYLWHLDIANEKVITEKALLSSIADTFGVPRNDRLANSALKTQGYVNNEKYAEQLLFHPDVSRQIDQVFNLLHRPREFNGLVRAYDFALNMFRRMVTVYNVPGFLVRNMMGDTFVNAVEGVIGTKGLSSQRQAMRVMRDHQNFDEIAQEAIHTPGGVTDLLTALDTRPSVNSTLFKTKHGEDVSSERLYAEYVRRGLSPSQYSSEMGLGDRFPSAGRLRRVTLDPIERATEAGAQFGRLSQFIHKVKVSDKPLNEAFDEATESVRRSLLDYNDFTPFEREIMSRVIPFYRFMRKNVPYMTQMMFTDPGKAMIPDKALRNLSLSQGYEFDESGVLEGELTPEWYRKGGAWPISDWNGNTIYASPDYMFNTFLKDFGSGDDTALALAYGQGSPLLTHAATAITGKEYRFGEVAEPEGTPLERLFNEIPQVRNVQNLMDPGQQNPGRYGQIAGVGTGLVRPNQQMAELMELKERLERSQGITGDEKSEKQLEFEENSSRIDSERQERFRHIEALMELIENGR